MKAANFTLEHLYYPILEVRANRDFNRGASDSEPTLPEVKIFISATETPGQLNMSLALSLQANTAADSYSIEALAVAYFTADKEVVERADTDHAAAKAIAISGPNMLYGAMRDQIMSITARSAWGMYILPSVVFESSDFELHSAPDE